MRLPGMLTLRRGVDDLIGFTTALQRILADIDPWWRARRGREFVDGLRSDDIPHCGSDTSRTFLFHIREHCDQDVAGHLDTLKWSVISEYLRFILEKSIPLALEGEVVYGLNWTHATLHDIDAQIEFFRDHFVPARSIDRVQLYYDTVQIFLEEQAEAAEETATEIPIGEAAQAAPANPEPTGEEKKTNGSIRKIQEIIDALARGEKPDMNEGDYLDISNDLKTLYVS